MKVRWPGYALFIAMMMAMLMAMSAAGQTPKMPKGFAGTQVCAVCHSALAKAFESSPHWVNNSEKGRGWEGRACESCHGPGNAHAATAKPDRIQNPAKLPQPQADANCFSCHRNQLTRHGVIQGPHARNQVACSACHSIHQPNRDTISERRGVLASRSRNVEGAGGQQTTTQLCGSCHSSILAQFQRPNHHRVPEGAMTCIDCHNPHGSLRNPAQRMISANEPGCFRCHTDKRGPFTYEHAPVRLDGCQSCHEPHGSANPRMLTRAEVRFQCLECHANAGPAASGAIGIVPPSFHDLRDPRYQNCTICHTKIHGSHLSRSLLR